jgi:hypothetical protein
VLLTLQFLFFISKKNMFNETTDGSLKNVSFSHIPQESPPASLNNHFLLTDNWIARSLINREKNLLSQTLV